MTARLVFVVGNSRSGTTMLARMLGLHPKIHTFQELHFFEELWSPSDAERVLNRDEAIRITQRLLHNARNWYLTLMERGAYRETAESIVDSLEVPVRGHEVFAAVVEHETAAAGAAVACEQTPRNVFYIREILELYPDALVVSLVRNPRDVLLSQRNWWKRRTRGSSRTPRSTMIRQWVDYHPITTSLLWRGGVLAADRAAADPRVLSLRFEDLVREPESALEPVLSALDLTFDRGMLQVPRQSSSNAPNRGGTGVDPSVSGHGAQALSREELWISQRITGSLARRHGYPPVTVSMRPWVLAWWLVQWPLKTVLAVVMNAQRSRNLLTSAARRIGGGRTSTGGSRTA